MRYSVSAALVAFASVPLSSAALAADGCAAGTYSSVTSPDGNATSLLFDDFSATAGGASGGSRAVSTCKLGVPVMQPDGHSVFAVDYRGYTTTQEGQSASIVTTQDGRQILRRDFAGPLDDDVSFSSRVGVSGSASLNLTVDVIAAGPEDDNDPEAVLFLDSLDLARIGFTTTASVQESANQIARQKQSITADLMDTAYGLLGYGNGFRESNYLATFANSDAAAGFNGRWEAGSGFSLLGGGALVNPNRTDVPLDTLALLAGGVRYTTPASTWRMFGEAGGWGSPNVSASLSRSYLNLANVVFAGGSASGSLASAYGRFGVIYTPDDANEFALSTRFNRSWLNLDGYAEDASGTNLFAARFANGTSTSDMASIELAWSHQTDGRLDFTIHGAVGRMFAGKGGTVAAVDWVGNVRGYAEDRNFAMAGGRIGWKIDEQWKIDTSVSARFRDGDKPDWNIGGQLKMSF